MTIKQRFDQAIASQGWNDDSQHFVLDDFINDQGLKSGLYAHLVTCAEDQGESVGDDYEGKIDELKVHMGWNCQSMVSMMLDFIGEKELDAEFDTHLQAQIDFENSPLPITR